MHKICSVQGCERETWARGWCGTHYQRWRKGLDFNAPLQPVGTRGARGTGYVTPDGYRRVYKEGGYILEHRWVMQNVLGRRLRRREHVHHIDGDRLNNDSGNLELWVTGHPSGQRVADVLAWARQILADYGEENL